MRKECELHYTPARDNQYRATARYYVDNCPYCQIEKLQSHIRLLAEAVLNGHGCCDYDDDCTFVGGCEVCKVAREVMG